MSVVEDDLSLPPGVEDRRPAPLHFATIGSVDDGKSTLIGRLLHDSKSIFEDQLAHIEAISQRRGDEYVDLALLTDGLRAEREQGITIDVAYRYFSTPHRDFVIADCPGHVQYTRNMVTGVSRAELAIVLVDARHGVVDQTRRHLLLASLLGVPHVVVAINKMDLVSHGEERFDEIVAEVDALAGRLDVGTTTLRADLGAHRGQRGRAVETSSTGTTARRCCTSSRPSRRVPPAPATTTARGSPCSTSCARTAPTTATTAATPARSRRASCATGDEVVVLPSGTRTTRRRHRHVRWAAARGGGRSRRHGATRDDVDASRGALLAAADDPPSPPTELTATLVLDGRDPPGSPRSGRTRSSTPTRRVRAMVTEVHHLLDVHDPEALGRAVAADTLTLNEIGLVSLRLTEPVFVDDYRRHRATGSFVLIDEATHQTVAAGMIRLDGDAARRRDDRRRRRGVARHRRSAASSAGRATGCAARPCGSPGCRDRGSRRWRTPSPSGCSRPGGRPTCSTATTCDTG